MAQNKENDKLSEPLENRLRQEADKGTAAARQAASFHLSTWLR